MAKQEKLKLCLASSEIAPLAKTGGLADVAFALSTYLHTAGHDVRVLMPFYSSIDTAGLDVVPVEDSQHCSLTFPSRKIDYSIDVATLPDSGLRIHLLRCAELYDRGSIYTNDADEHLRFIVLSRAAIDLCERQQFSPHVFHSHDWHTALIPLLLRTHAAYRDTFANTRTALTIHNIGYQGNFSTAILPDLGIDADNHMLDASDLASQQISFLKTGVRTADLLTTVSPTYAQEILGPEYGMGLEGAIAERSGPVAGILNGVDYAEWHPLTDTLIPHNYSIDRLLGKTRCKRALQERLGIAVDPETPLIGIVSRLASQKGIDLIQAVVPELLAERDFSLTVLGSGDPGYESFFQSLASRFPDRVSFSQGYNNELAHWIEAGADMFLMPSLYEPCGLNQMYSLKYGTVPIVRETGGLADSVQPIDPDNASGTGVVFRDYDANGLRWAINTALDQFAEPLLWRKVIRNGMAMDFSWQSQGQQYVELFRELIAARN